MHISTASQICYRARATSESAFSGRLLAAFSPQSHRFDVTSTSARRHSCKELLRVRGKLRNDTQKGHVSIVVCALQSHVTVRIGIAAKVGREDVSLVLERGQKVLCDNITFSGCRTPRSFHRSTAAWVAEWTAIVRSCFSRYMDGRSCR